ncbi:MAG: hypothetical protein JNM63_00145 [Spirochaetia bacterium]|nr:hypothetical protein [Spirochaetia bacterium]
MRAFKFRFEAVLENRRREEENVIRDMSPLVSKMNQVVAGLEKIREGLLQFNRQKVAYLESADRISQYTSSIGYFRENQKKLETDRAKIENDLTSHREKLMEAVKRRKALEVLKKRDHESWIFKKKKIEEIALEDLAASRKAGMLF